MGYDRKEFTVCGSVSRHNSEKDVRDDALWQDIQERVRAMLAEEQYEPLRPDIV